MGTKHFEAIIDSELHKVSVPLKDGLDFISANLPPIPDDDLMDLKLIFSELIYNAIIHGNKYDPDKKVTFIIDISQDGSIHSTISDEGDGFDYSEFMHSYTSASKLSFSESGRGIFLARALCDSLNFNGAGNVIYFSKKVVLKHVQHNNS